jgi:type VI secretion system protein ImpG
MDALLPYIERELDDLRRQGAAFARRYPRLAGALPGGQPGADPHVQRLIDAVAVLNARATRRLEDDYPLFAQSLLRQLYPVHPRPFPACSIVRFSAGGSGTTAVPCGTAVRSAPLRGVTCRFRTTADVTLADARVAAARFEPAGADGNCAIVLALEGVTAAGPRRLRLFLNGAPSFCAALRDALFLHATGATVDVAGRRVALPSLPLCQAGFDADEALLPHGPRGPEPAAILAEYFAFPARFDFIDVDLAALTSHAVAGAIALRIALAGIAGDGVTAGALAPLCADHLLTHCVPVVNLFDCAATPLTLGPETHGGIVTLNGLAPAAHEVFAIGRVDVSPADGTAPARYESCYTRRADEEGSLRGRWWTVRRDERLAAVSPGHETVLALFDGMAPPVAGVVSFDITCTNRDYPTFLMPGELRGEGAAASCAVYLLRQPSAPRRVAAGPAAHWRLLAHLALARGGLAQGDDAASLTALLALYDVADTAVSRRQIAAVAGLRRKPASAWLRDRQGTVQVPGVEVAVLVDPSAFAGTGLHLFAQAIDHVLAHTVQLNGFVQTVLVAATTEEELLRCPPRNEKYLLNQTGRRPA